MKEITEEEYEEFLRLKSLYKRETIRASCESIAALEDDIDAPIKNCVAYLALLGCTTTWACCGFDYAGQPIHKSHEYGASGVVMLDTPEGRRIVRLIESSAGMPFQNRANGWRYKYRTHYGDDMIYLTSNLQDGNSWPDKDCIHYSEPGAISIGLLEKFLLSLSGEFLDCVTAVDYNSVYKARYPNWQYPPKADWVIRKQDYLNV